MHKSEIYFGVSLKKPLTNYLYQIITNERSGFIATCIKIALRPLSWIYFLGLMAYKILIQIGLLRLRKLPCEVVSIGNIVVGGTGKTPTAIAVAEAFRDAGRRSAILLRGYRSSIDADWAVVSDGDKILLSLQQAGDEAFMIAKELPGIPVLIGKERYRTGIEAVKRWGVDVVILDDGFQHRKLEHDIDIVVIDVTCPFGTGGLLPRGTLREPRRGLRRADLILITRADQVVDCRDLREEIGRYAPNVPIMESIHAPECLYQIGTRELIGLEFLENKSVLAVCGIGNPESFAETLSSLNVSRVELLAFDDHCQYDETAVKKIFERQTESNSEIIVATKKDEQKLLAFFQQCNEWSCSSSDFNGQSYLPSIYILSIKLTFPTNSPRQDFSPVFVTN